MITQVQYDNFIALIVIVNLDIIDSINVVFVIENLDINAANVIVNLDIIIFTLLLITLMLKMLLLTLKLLMTLMLLMFMPQRQSNNTFSTVTRLLQFSSRTAKVEFYLGLFSFFG